MKESSSGENSRYRTDSLFGLSKVLPVHDTIPQALLTLSLFTFAKSAIIPLTFHLTRFLNPFYSEPNCLLRLVNETAPAHYEAHQYWRQLSYDNTCTDLKSFVLDQFNDYAQIEFKVWQVLGPAMFFTACIAVVYPLLTTNPNLGSTKAPALSIISASVLPCHFTMAAMFMYIHFQMDLTFLVGNIQHHSDISGFTDKSNASTVDTLPQGFLLTYFFNILWLTICFKYLFQYLPRLQHFSNASIVSSQFLLSGQISLKMLKHDHPLFHAVAKESWANAFPFSFEYRAYHHVFRHHVNGDSFGSSWLFDPLFSKMFDMFTHLHNQVFRLTTVDTWQHYAVVCTFDTLQGLVVLAIILAMFMSATFLTQGLAGGGKAGHIARAVAILFFGFWLFINGFVLRKDYYGSDDGAGDDGSIMQDL